MRLRVLAGLAPALLVVSVSSQAAPVVTEDQFLAILGDDHPAVVERAQALAAAEARLIAARTFEDPVLGVEREDPEGPEQKTDWTLSWQLPGAGRRLEIEARRQTSAAEAARLSHELSSLRRTLRKVYAEWALAAARLERLTEQETRVVALARLQRSRFELGEASGLEARRLELAAAGLGAQLALAAADAEAARASARSWHPELPADAEPRLPALGPGLAPAQEHPLVRAARGDLEAATLERQVAGRVVPTPEFLVGWQQQELGAESSGGPLLGLQWSVPLLGRNRAEKALAETRVAEAQARLQMTRRELESASEIGAETYRRLVAATEQAEAVRQGNAAMLRAAEAAFLQGESSLTDLLETIRAAGESELMVLSLHEAALAAHRELERLADPSDTPGPEADAIPEGPAP